MRETDAVLGIISKSPESRMHLKVPVRFGGGPMEKDRTKRATPRPRPTQCKEAIQAIAAYVDAHALPLPVPDVLSPDDLD